jgi:LPS sulfotransferase NodH
MLSDTGIAGAPDEFFFYILNAPRPPWTDWLKDPCNKKKFSQEMEKYTTENGVFGANIMWKHFYYIIYQLRQLFMGELVEVDTLLANAFYHPAYILTTRRDKVRQAVSLWRAQQTGGWISSTQWLSPFWTANPVFDYVRIHALIQEIKADESAWQWFFTHHGIQPLEIVYEDFIAEPDQTLRMFFAHIGVAIPDGLVLPKPGMKKQADAMTESWVEQYYDCQKNAT